MARKLHIGGKHYAEGWEILNITPGPYVDHPGDARDLSRFPDNTFAKLYASHVLEHFDYSRELLAVLREWRRVLVPRGELYVSVPDLDVLARLFLEKERFDAAQRFFIMRMMFGGQVDRFDYHLAGLNEEFLRGFLGQAGYVNVRRVDDFGCFKDSSGLRFGGIPISCNMIAAKPAE